LDNEALGRVKSIRGFAAHGWIGMALVAVFWGLNWGLSGARTQWAFFPLWLGYCLFVDALVLYRTGTSLLVRSRHRYVSLFVISAIVWWLFELVNWRLKNWRYDGSELFLPLEFWFWATLNFTTVVPAVFGSAELAASFRWIQNLRGGPVIRPDRRTTLSFFIAGLVMFALMWAWPLYFFPFVWLSIYFMLEPLNVWLDHRSLADHTARGDWRPVVALWIGVLITAFFWEMWNYFSYPKWVYDVPWVGFLHLFEMPLLGYGGYLPFAMELYAVVHLLYGLLGDRQSEYIRLN
jgi:hypothetical protein